MRPVVLDDHGLHHLPVLQADLRERERDREIARERGSRERGIREIREIRESRNGPPVGIDWIAARALGQPRPVNRSRSQKEPVGSLSLSGMYVCLCSGDVSLRGTRTAFFAVTSGERDTLKPRRRWESARHHRQHQHQHQPAPTAPTTTHQKLDGTVLRTLRLDHGGGQHGELFPQQRPRRGGRVHVELVVLEAVERRVRAVRFPLGEGVVPHGRYMELLARRGVYVCSWHRRINSSRQERRAGAW